MDLEALLAAHETQGAVVGTIAAGEHTVVAAGTRGADRGPVERDTVFAAASLTKPVFALGVLALVDRGALELDRPLGEYLPEPYVADDPRADGITARMVLSHTTGLQNERMGGEPLALAFTPGERFRYSGEGFTYLQRVVERLCAVPVADHLTDAVLRPLGMTDSTFAWPGAEDGRLAIGHDEDGAARPLFRPPPAKVAAGGLFTTAPDYLRFLQHCLVHEHRMFVPQVHIDEDLAWGLGWGIETGQETAVWQWGNDPGYKSYVLGRAARGDGLVVFTNGDRGADVYAAVVRELLPGPHPSLEPWQRSGWTKGWAAT